MTEIPTPTATQAWSSVMDDVRSLAKGDRNKVQNFSFRGVDAVLNAVGPVLRTHRVIVVPVNIDAKHRDFLDGKGKTVHEAIVTVTYRVTGPAGDHFEGMSIGEAADYSDKATSQAMSVAERVFFIHALTLPTDDQDPDHNTVDRASGTAPAAQAAPPKPPFTADEAKGAFADLHARMAEVAEPAFGEMVKWMETNAISDSTLTRETARDWYERISKAPKREATPAAEKVDGGWRTAKERDETWESLSERQDRIPHPVDIDKPLMETMTRQESAEWLASIVIAEEEPF
jgi:hypothetical protein